MGEVAKARLRVAGRVQGVFYRQSTKEKAQSLGIVGWVRNQDDGSVALEALGPRDAVERLIAWCRQGPPSARVDSIDVEWLDAANDESCGTFRIVG
jgi:acylphosphatase